MPTLAPGAPRQIDLGNPVNWGHPDNAGLILSLQGLPTYPGVGGNTWPDLSKITGGPSVGSGQTWAATSSPEYGLKYSGTAGNSCPLNLGACNKCLIAFWSWVDAYTGVVVGMEYSTDYNSADAFIWLPDDGSTATLNLHGGGGYAQNTYPRPSAAAWHRVVFFLDRSLNNNVGAVRVYVDGAAVAVTPSGTTLVGGTFGSSLNLYLMARNLSTLPTAGRLAGLRVHGFTSTQLLPDIGWVARDYVWSQNLQIDPRLRRFTPATRVFGGAATSPPAGIHPWWQYAQPMMGNLGMAG